MGPRSKKRKPSFRKLLKTSSLKLENKLKNRNFKQQNVDKKQRKEQRKLRQAVRNISQETPRPLEVYKKTPEEENEEEDFEESLPLDMMEEEDLEEIRAMAQRASFITRDLTLSDPVHVKKRKMGGGAEEEETYEKHPRRRNQPMEEKEVIHLLPIKDKTRLIPQSIERPVIHKDDEDDEEEENTGLEHFENEEEPESSTVALTAEEREQLRVHKLTDRKLRIGSLASAIITDPTNNIKKLKELRSMLMETDVLVAVTVRKLVMVSLMEIFKDITPSYRIRALTETEKNTKVKKETQLLREFEEGLVSQYKFYLEDLEQVVKDWRQQKRKRSDAVGLGSYRTLAEVSVRCLCELLLSLSHFNFHNNIIVMLVPLMIHTDRKVSTMCCEAVSKLFKQVSTMCCEAVSKLFKQDKVGVASLGAVRVISGLVKSLNYNVKPQVLQTLLCLRIKEVEVKKDTEDKAPKMKKMYYKDKQKNLSRMQRKWKKAEEKLEKELLEAEATENKDAKIKLHTETLNMVFLIYFRILKKAPRPYLLPAVLEGLAKFAHLINLEFFDDLLNVLQGLIQSGELSHRENLHCIQTAFNILSGQGDVLNIDPLKFYSQLYETLLQLDAGQRNDDIIIVLRCLDAMLTRRRKHVTLQRAMSFVKRLGTLSVHSLPSAAVGLMAACRSIVHAFPRCDMLLDNESQGSGVYLPELNQPEYCNPQNTALWELHTLMRHYHPIVRRFASHLSRGAPSEGSGCLPVELSRRLPEELFEDYSFNDMTFNPAVSAPSTTKKDWFSAGHVLVDSELQREVSSILSACQEDSHTHLDFSTNYTHCTT